MDLQSYWFVLLGALLTGYAILDGFDLGVGILHPAARTDHDRRIFLNSIGPLWDGNEVWLVTFGGALFAAFPEVYRSVFSGFYTAFMLVLFGLIFRAVSIEFRSKTHSRIWRSVWDYGFFVGSTLATFVFGVAVGNIMRGVPLGPDGELRGDFFDLLLPYPILIGVFAVSLFAMHGSIYLYLKTEGELQQRVHGWMWRTFGIFLVLYMFTTIVTLVMIPRATANFAREFQWAWLIVLLNILAVANIPRAIYLNRPFYAFVSSCCTIAALTFLFGGALYPNLVTSQPNPEHSLNIYNAASSETTLWIMRLIAFLGMPFVIAYTSVVYWVFRGKVEIGKMSY